MRTDPEVQRAVSSYQLGLPRTPVSGRSGELLGRGTGSSLEFQEHREYLPGDDIRHLDWAAYARSDTLMVRLYREEISPRTEILLDASRSMNSAAPGKTEIPKSFVARQLAAMFALLSGELGGRPSILPLNNDRPLRTIDIPGLHLLTDLPFDAAVPLDGLLEQNLILLKRQAVRIVISDFLFPHDPVPLIRKLATEASALWVIQVLNEWEANPTVLGGRRLTDLETTAETDMLINQKTIDEYLQRLTRLQTELATNCRRVHATFVTLIADRGLQTLCREDLCRCGILRAE